MIIQGSNIPITVTFTDSVEPLKKIVASLWSSGKMLKQWNREDMTVAYDTITLPLDEDETRKFKKGKVELLVKGLNMLDETVFYEEAMIVVDDRYDKNIDLVPKEG